jgi:hypothetical protein
MYRYIFLLNILSSLLFSIDLNTTLIDKYYDTLCQVLVDSSNSIDDYFIESDTNITENKTEAELKTYFAIENGQNAEYAMRLRLRIDLPKIKDKLRLILEDEDSDNIFNDGTELDNQLKIENKYYFLRLDYFRYIKEKLNITSGIGVRFKMSSILYPYINIKARYMIKEYNAVVSNRFRIYSDKKVENTLSLNKMEYFDDNAYILFRNFIKYRNNTDITPIVNSLSITKIISEKQKATIGASLSSEFVNLRSYIRYPQIYISYRDKLYKDWAYYEITPSILWREENNYDKSYRFMFSIGANFKKRK